METASHLAARITLATNKDTILGLVFESSLRQIAATHGEAEADGIRREALKDRAKGMISFFRYPIADLLKMVERSMLQKPPADFHAALEGFGGAAVGNFFESPIGRTMMSLGGSSPHRLMSSAPAGYKALVSYGERGYEKTGPNSAIMTFKGEFLGAAWQAGTFRKALESACKVQPKIELTLQNDSATDFQMKVSW